MIFSVLYIPDGCFGISGPSIGMFDTLVVDSGTPKRIPLDGQAMIAEAEELKTQVLTPCGAALGVAVSALFLTWGCSVIWAKSVFANIYIYN